MLISSITSKRKQTKKLLGLITKKEKRMPNYQLYIFVTLILYCRANRLLAIILLWFVQPKGIFIIFFLISKTKDIVFS
jgi:hypothetical protein